MNKNTYIIIGVIALVVIVGGVYASMRNNDDAMMVKDQMEQKAMEDTKVPEGGTMVKKEEMETETMIKKEAMEDTKMTEEKAMMKTGSYEAYSPEKIARAEKGDVVLFFHASWCPSCRSLNSDIEKNISSIPEGVSILKVDYDKETELKKKYGVTYQHTLVQVDKDGNLIKKWSGSPKLANLVSEIK
ncbi:MAG: thioredoxin family protein [bacterium]